MPESKRLNVLLRDFRPKKVIIFSRDELKQHEMRQTWNDGADGARFMSWIAETIKDPLIMALEG